MKLHQNQHGYFPSHVPTPQEIREACLRFQDSWSHVERNKRLGFTQADLWQLEMTVPVVVCGFELDLWEEGI